MAYPLSSTSWGAEEIAALQRVIKSGRFTMGTEVQRFEEAFAARFGVSISRAMNDARDITHNLRTAIVDGEGRIVKVYTGNDWSPKQVLADLETLASKT